MARLLRRMPHEPGPLEQRLVQFAPGFVGGLEDGHAQSDRAEEPFSRDEHVAQVGAGTLDLRTEVLSAERYTPSQKAEVLEYAAAHGVSEAALAPLR